MGRPLKIAKLDGLIIKDNGIPSLASSEIGAIGGNPSISGYQVVVRVKIGAVAEGDGYILRQKGRSKFLVADATGVSAGAFISGNYYVITSLGTTDWQAIGASAFASVGNIFKATGAGSGTGTANTVGVCTLSDLADAALTSNTMTATVWDDGSTLFRIKRLSNKFVTDFNDVKYFVSMTNAAAAPGNPAPYWDGAKVQIEAESSTV